MCAQEEGSVHKKQSGVSNTDGVEECSVHRNQTGVPRNQSGVRKKNAVCTRSRHVCPALTASASLATIRAAPICHMRTTKSQLTQMESTLRPYAVHIWSRYPLRTLMKGAYVVHRVVSGSEHPRPWLRSAPRQSEKNAVCTGISQVCTRRM